MGLGWSWLTGGRHLALDVAHQSAADLDEGSGVGVTRFAVDSDSIDPAVFGLTSYASPTAPAARIDRRTAIQVPAVKRSRDLVAGVLGTLPIRCYGPDRQPASCALFEQPEKHVPRSITMTKTFEDMFFEGVAWWRITEFGWHGYPVKAKRLDARSVTVDKETEKVYVNGKVVPDEELIRFDSPNDGLLLAGARAIRTALALDAAAANRSDGTPPIDYFTPTEGVDPFTDEEMREFLAEWNAARRDRSTGYVPAALKYNEGGIDPDKLQLAEARQHAVLEIARVGGIDPEELGVSTTSRTYANQFDRRKQYTDFTLGGYITAMQDRLSMGDVTPRGYIGRLDLSEFQRSDDLTRFQAYAAGLAVGAIDPNGEVREAEGKAPLTSPPPAPAAPAAVAPTALPAPQEVTR